MKECMKTVGEAADTIVCVASNGLWWVSPLVIAVSAFVAAIISIRSIRSNKQISKQRATLDLIERSESTQYYQNLYRAFTQIRKDKAGFEQLIDVTNPQVMDQRQKVISYLNHY